MRQAVPGADGVGVFPEMHAVLADGQAPAEIGAAVEGAVGVVLVAHMEGAIHPDQAVGVIDPAAAGGKMHLLAVRLPVDVRVKVRAGSDGAAGGVHGVEQTLRRVFILGGERHLVSLQGVQVQRAPEARVFRRYRHIELTELLSGSVGDLHVIHPVRIPQRQVQDAVPELKSPADEHEYSPFLYCKPPRKRRASPVRPSRGFFICA